MVYRCPWDRTQRTPGVGDRGRNYEKQRMWKVEEISGGASRPRGMTTLPKFCLLACLLSRDCSSLCLPLSHSPCLYAKQTLFINYSTFLTECASALDSFSAATTNPSKGAYEMKTICHLWPNSKETHNERGRLKDWHVVCLAVVLKCQNDQWTL